MQNIDC